MTNTEILRKNLRYLSKNGVEAKFLQIINAFNTTTYEFVIDDLVELSVRFNCSVDDLLCTDLQEDVKPEDNCSETVDDDKIINDRLMQVIETLGEKCEEAELLGDMDKFVKYAHVLAETVNARTTHRLCS